MMEQEEKEKIDCMDEKKEEKERMREKDKNELKETNHQLYGGCTTVAICVYITFSDAKC